jgi:predicted dinucleotide-binding enzyme
MKIGIIGAGHIGGTLTRRLSASGYEVLVANSRGPETLTALAEETGAIPVFAKDAAQNAQLVVVTIPMKHISTLPDDIFEGVPDDVIVVDTNNYYPRQRDGRIEAIEDGMVESKWVEQQLKRPVVKAFNNIYADHLLRLGKPSGSPGRIALPVAGDDALNKNVVFSLIDQIGFDAVDAGTINESWRQQPGTPVYTADHDIEGVKLALNQAKRERGESWRGTPNSPGTYENPA